MQDRVDSPALQASCGSYRWHGIRQTNLIDQSRAEEKVLASDEMVSRQNIYLTADITQPIGDGHDFLSFRYRLEMAGSYIGITDKRMHLLDGAAEIIDLKSGARMARECDARNTSDNIN